MSVQDEREKVGERLRFLATWRYGLSDGDAAEIVGRWMQPNGEIATQNAIVEIRSRSKIAARSRSDRGQLTEKDRRTIKVLLLNRALRQRAGQGTVCLDWSRLLDEFRLDD